MNVTHYTCMHTGTTFYIKNKNKNKHNQNKTIGVVEKSVLGFQIVERRKRKKPQTKKREYMGTEE